MLPKIMTAALLALSPLPAFASEIIVGYGQGEFKNEITTRQKFIEIRQDLGNLPVYLLSRHEDNAHPVEGIDRSSTKLGGGVRLSGPLENIAIELSGDEHKYLGQVYYANQHGPVEFRGGLLHGNLYDQGFKQTFIKLSSGYRLTKGLHLGAFYQVGNTTKRSVDDLWGGYLKFSY